MYFECLLVELISTYAAPCIRPVARQDTKGGEIVSGGQAANMFLWGQDILKCIKTIVIVNFLGAKIFRGGGDLPPGPLATPLHGTQ